jgi:hypothetical protein
LNSKPGDRVRARDEGSNTTVVGVLSTEEVDSAWGTYTRYIVTTDDGGYRFIDADSIRPADNTTDPVDEGDESLSTEQMVARLDAFLQPLVAAGWEVSEEFSTDTSGEWGPSVFRDVTRGKRVTQFEYVPNSDAVEVWGGMAKHYGDEWQDAVDTASSNDPDCDESYAVTIAGVAGLSPDAWFREYTRLGLLP